MFIISETKAMEFTVIVKHIAGFLSGVDRIQFSQARSSISADLRLEVRGFELSTLRAALRENLKATRLVAVLTKLLHHLYEPLHYEMDGLDADGHRALMTWRMHEVGQLLRVRLRMFDLDIPHDFQQVGTPEENRDIFEHFLNQMD